jgi:hypothetical protein
MIEWWWLLVEAALLCGSFGALWGWSWNEALAYALTAPDLARRRLEKLPIPYQLKLNRAVRARLMRQAKRSLKVGEQLERHLDSQLGLKPKPKDRR